MTHQTSELLLAPWYFDGESLRAAGDSDIGPDFGRFTPQMLLGMVRGLRIWKEAQATRPVRSPAFVRSYVAAERDPAWHAPSICNSAAEAPAYAYLQSRLAGLPGGFFVDIEQIAALPAARTDMLVIPSMRGATKPQIAAIRKKYREGVALVCFDDCTGLEDIFGVRRLKHGIEIATISRAKEDTLLQGAPAEIRHERVAHTARLLYRTDGAEEVLSCYNKEGERVAPLLTIRTRGNAPGAVFFALGATEVGRYREPLSTVSIEGMVVSQLIRHALRAAMLRVARPIVRVTPPASLLAFWRTDDTLYVVIQDASFPFIPSRRGPIDVELRVQAEGANSARIQCEKPFEEAARSKRTRRLRLRLNPDEVVTMVIAGIEE